MCLCVPHLCTCGSRRAAKAKVQDMGGTALGFFGAYYEDHIQPVTGSYADWVSDVRGSMWEKIQTAVDNYMPFRATNATDPQSKN